MIRTRKLNNKGMSLLEVVIAMVILVLISLPLLKYFTDSIKYTAKMEEKQEAVLYAQQLVEDMNNQPKLVAMADDGSGYAVKYLGASEADGGLGFTLKANTFQSNATGVASYSSVVDDKDVVVTVSATTPVDDTLSATYGMNAATDVMAVERSQQDLALLTFKSYAQAAGTDSSDATILSNMRRDIMVNIGKSGPNYTIKVYYVYYCINAAGSGITSTYTSTALLNTKTPELENIYLLYNRLGTTAVNFYDDVKITCTGEAEVERLAGSLNPTLYLICQNKKVNDDSYSLRVTTMSVNQEIHSNISAAEMTGRVKDASGNVLTTLPLVDTAPATRLVNIQVEVYPKAHQAGDDAYIVINSTKGE